MNTQGARPAPWNTTSATYESETCESKEAEHARLQFDAHLEVYVYVSK